MENLWITVVVCVASFVCGMWLKDVVLNWITKK